MRGEREREGGGKEKGVLERREREREEGRRGEVSWRVVRGEGADHVQMRPVGEPTFS